MLPLGFGLLLAFDFGFWFAAGFVFVFGFRFDACAWFWVWVWVLGLMIESGVYKYIDRRDKIIDTFIFLNINSKSNNKYIFKSIITLILWSILI